MNWQEGDRIQVVSRTHGPGTGTIVRVTRWRHKTFYHVDWAWESGDRMETRERAGRDDADWERID